MIFLLVLSLLTVPARAVDLLDGDSYYKFDPVSGVVDLVPYSLESPQMALSSEILDSETFELEEAAPVLGSPSPSTSVDFSTLASLAHVHVTSELGVGTVYLPRSYISSLSLSDDGFLCNPLSGSVSGYFKSDDGLIYDVSAQSMHPFRYWDTTDRQYYYLNAAPDSGGGNMTFQSGDSPFGDGEELLLFIAVLILGVILLVK